VHVDPLRLAARKPFPPTVFELADQLLLLGVDALITGSAVAMWSRAWSLR
jgi:hypothetical protein